MKTIDKLIRLLLNFALEEGGGLLKLEIDINPAKKSVQIKKIKKCEIYLDKLINME